MDSDFSAYDVVNTYKEDELVRIFSEYGEERFSKRIAKKIVEVRRTEPIRTTKALADIIISATPRVKSNIHPSTREFQAIRIDVNTELKNVNFVLHDILDLLEFDTFFRTLSHLVYLYFLLFLNHLLLRNNCDIFLIQHI